MNLDEECWLAMAAMLFFGGWYNRMTFGSAGHHTVLPA